ncbi:duf625 domain containing protein [Grosmannia clavigera kw1407]|uniref:Duf625 domain containing protein n=1 Tax=Grosmannia clavigera (strain kw1407 / UAMH 11150) TaxID=655863 RepID=F0XHW8_GROCL|nr:duf625 domain containing protein [Grosmannia clavigera kw1407]EFX03091.1 duf625 domain containing protein [Grosmannia clavigera kw1407]
MMAQPVPHQPIDRKRVKVYELRNNDWFDRGTGFCSAAYFDDGDEKEPRVIVESEDEPESDITDPVALQIDTLIVWTEPRSGLDMALSFQEAEGCLLIWNFISEIQQTMGAAMPDDSLSDDLAMDMPPAITLPPADLNSLQELENNMRIMSATAGGRDALTRCIMSEDYIRKLIPLVEMAEDLESLPDLHHLCNIVKIILLLNDTSIIEHAVSDECVLGVVGALEYDPDFPSHKANHRQWLNNQGRYKEVVRIQDEVIRKKIHQTYRLQYLKDVVLARILDDPTFSVLNSLIFFNQVDIVQHLQSNGGFLGDLFGIFTDPTEAVLRKKQAVLFIQQCCSIAKNLQPPARMTLYNNFLSHGLLHVINFGLRNPDVSVRVGATDILVSMIDHDPQMIRQTIYRQMHEQQAQLTDTLIDLLLVEVDLGIKSQISDALKVLLDPVLPNNLPSAEAMGAKNANGDVQQRMRQQHMLQSDPVQDRFLDHFYERSAARLFKPLIDLENKRELSFSVLDDGIFSYLNDILCFFIRQHHHRFAVRFFRQLVAMRDEFYNQHIMHQRLIDPILDLVSRTLPRDNLICSAGLEFFDFFTKEDLGELTKHLVEVYREKLHALSYMQTFSDLLAGKYPPNQAAITHVNNPDQPLITDQEDAAQSANGTGRALMESIAMDPDEEYWNTDDEEELEQTAMAAAAAGNATGRPLTDSPSLKQLVDYASDEEGEDDEDDEAEQAEGGSKGKAEGEAVGDPDKENSPSPSSGSLEAAVRPASSSPVSVSSRPPERISEKRRREEDEEDELGKLMLQNKRRNSVSASTNGMAALLPRKRSVSAGRDVVNGSGNGNGAATGLELGKKISINITSSALKTATTAEDDDMA